MRRRLEVFIPIVLLAILVQLMAPIAAFRVVANAVSDPLYHGDDLLGNGVLSGCLADNSHQDPTRRRQLLCGLRVGHGGVVAADPPPLVFATLQRQYQLVAWLEAADPTPASARRLECAGARAAAADVTLAAIGRSNAFTTKKLRRIPMSIRLLRAGLPGLAMIPVILLVPLTGGAAHEIVGNRFFPATLGIDDPGVNDELSLPTVANFKTGDDPSVRQRDISGEFSKRITEAFAVSFGSTFTSLKPPGGLTGMGASGFQNLETTFKYRVYKNPEHEFVMSVGLSVEWGGTGAAKCRRGSVQHLHADDIFRQRVRRSSGYAVLDQTGRGHRPGRICDPGEKLDHHVWHRSG